MAIHFLLAFPPPVPSLCPKLFTPACWRRQWPVESVHWIWICAFAFNSGLAPSLFGSGLRFCHFKMRRRSCILFLSCRDTSDGYVRFSWGQLSCLKRKTDRRSGCHSLVMNANYTPVVPYEEHVVSARFPLTISNSCPRNHIRNDVSEKWHCYMCNLECVLTRV